MKFVCPALIFSFALLSPVALLAQLDSSYELLLGTRTPSLAPAPAPALKKIAKKSQQKTRQPASEETTVASPVLPPLTLPPLAPKEPTISQQVKSLFTASPERELGFYQGQFEESDARQNKIEISFAPSYVTNESSSNYSYRDYRSVYAGVDLGANVWLTPAIGVGGNFMFSLAADTSGDAVSNTRSPARYEFLDVALKFRQFFGFTQSSKSLQFDVLYSDYKFNVNADDIYRAKLKTSGLGLKMTLRLPSSPDVAWLLGGSFYPRLQHSESKAGIDISSGSSTENIRLGIQLGSEIKLSKESQIFYEASLMSEKNLFDGSARLADPATGSIPKNVSVTDTFYIFSLGYRWGG